MDERKGNDQVECFDENKSEEDEEVSGPVSNAANEKKKRKRHRNKKSAPGDSESQGHQAANAEEKTRADLNRGTKTKNTLKPPSNTRTPKSMGNQRPMVRQQACYLDFLRQSGGNPTQHIGYAAQSWDILRQAKEHYPNSNNQTSVGNSRTTDQNSGQWPPQRKGHQKGNKQLPGHQADTTTPEGPNHKIRQGEKRIGQGMQQASSSGGGARNKTRKQVFEPYWEGKNVSDGLKRGLLIQAAVRINPKNYEECYVPHPDGVSDILISGMHDRNRALNGDEVAVVLYPRNQWKVLMDDFKTNARINPKFDWFTKSSDTDVSDMLENMSLRDSSNNLKTPTKDTQTRQKGKTGTPKNRHVCLRDLCTTPDAPSSAAVQKNLENELCDSDSGSEKVLLERMSSVPDGLLLRTGKIVCIVERKHSRASTGTIRLMQDKNANFALFVPKDHRFPRLMVPMGDCPKDFLKRPDDHQNTLFIGRLTDWPEDSMYPKGRLARSLGEAGLIEPETEGMLIENGVDYSEFPEAAIDCLPKDLPWKIPPKEFEYRKDLRKECIFTIDPATARDLDDALHCTKLADGTYEIGVHIADVSFFIEERSALDDVAASRATSVYLIQKVIPMLPRLLCEQLCSLNPDEDRLAFSVIWKMTETGEITDEWFGRSIIRSCAKLSYEHAQGFIEEPDKEWDMDELPRVSEGFTVPMIVERVLNLQKVAVHLRKKRFDSGALRLDQVKLSFALDKESGLPCGYSVYQQKDSNRLIEEFMLLANMAVSHKIYKRFPEISMLRRHPPPQEKQLDDLIALCKTFGIHLDSSSAGSLQQTLWQYGGESAEERARMQVIVAMTTKPMQNARYFCTGCIDDEEIYRHYALNVPLYTHFTSPIRRFPDVVVHRLLAAALDLCDPPCDSKGEVQARSDHCNDKKWASKRVQEASSDLYFSMFVKECGPLEEKGIVMGVLDKAFDVLVLSLGVSKRVYCDQLPLESHNFRKDHKKPELTLTWKEGKQEQLLTIFTEVRCLLTSDPAAGPLKWKAVIKHPAE